MADAETLPDGPSLGGSRYRLTGVLGQGGMSTVYRALDTDSGRERAIKMLSPARKAHDSLVRRFEREARALELLRHPNIVQVHDVGAEGADLFIVMDLAEGGSLHERIKRHGPLAPQQAVRVVLEVLEGLAHAHEKHVVHRDIKPANVLLSAEGRPQLTDFGIARVAGQDQTLTRTGMVMGTLAFMAPEQREDAKRADDRADIYAVGATLYALVTGREPFDLYSTELHGVLFQDVPPALQAPIKQACRYRPQDRFDSCAELARELRAALGALPPDPPDQPPLAVPVHIQPLPASGITAVVPASDGEVSHPTMSPASDVVSGPAASLPPPGITSGDTETWSQAPVGPAQAAARRPALVLGAAAGGALAVLVLGAALGWFSPGTAAPEPSAGPPPAPPAEVAADEVLASVGAPDEVPGEAEAAAEREAPATSPEAEVSPGAATEEPPASSERPSASAQTRPAASPPPEAVGAEAAGGVGNLGVNSRPWSYVSIDGESVGRTGRFHELSAGPHEVRLQTADGRSHQARVRVVADERKVYCWDFGKDAECGG